MNHFENKKHCSQINYDCLPFRSTSTHQFYRTLPLFLKKKNAIELDKLLKHTRNTIMFHLGHKIWACLIDYTFEVWGCSKMTLKIRRRGYGFVHECCDPWIGLIRTSEVFGTFYVLYSQKSANFDDHNMSSVFGGGGVEQRDKSRQKTAKNRRLFWTLPLNASSIAPFKTADMMKRIIFLLNYPKYVCVSLMTQLFSLIWPELKR